MAGRRELSKDVAKRTGLKLLDAEPAVEAVITSIKKRLVAGEEITITGFGRFDTRQRSQRRGRNPQTGEDIVIPERKVPAFKAGMDFRKAIRES